MRPGRLGQVFDDAGDVIVALDQEHVAGLQRLAQRVGIARRERLIAVNRLLQIAGDQPPNAIEHPAHWSRDLPACARFCRVFFLFVNLRAVPCNLVHAASRVIDSKLNRSVCPTARRSGNLRRNVASVLETMPGKSAAAKSTFVPRRLGRAGGAPRALAATAPSSGPFDVVIVGAGAAGIAAARRIAAAGRRYVVIEATDHIGGRCVTDTKSFGVPFDRGAHWIYLPDSNPVTKLTPRAASTSIRRRKARRCAIGRRYAREGELEDFLTAQVRATRAIDDAARKADIPCEQAVPPDLGDWRANDRIRARPVHLRQGPGAGVVLRLCARRRAQCGGVLQAGIRRAARRARPRAQRSAVDAGKDDRHPGRHHGGNRQGHDHRTRRDRHRADQCHRLRRPQVQSRPRPSPDRRASAGCRSAATTTSRSSFSAIRWASKATIWCFKNRPTRTPRRFSPTSPARSSV